MRIKFLLSVFIGISANIFAQKPFPYVMPNEKTYFQDELCYEQSV